MKLKNNVLQELYDTLVSGNPTISPYAESPFDKAFRECDEKIQSEIDIWNALEHEARSAIKRLEEDISTLKEHISDTCKTLNNVISERDEAKSQLNYCTHSRDNWCARAKYAEDEVERLRKAHDELFDAGSRKISELRRENEAVNKKLTEEVEELHKHIDILSASEREALSAKNALEKDLDDAKSSVQYFRASRNDWERRAKLAEEVLHTTEEVRDNIRAELESKVKRMDETLEKANSDRTELQNDRDFYHGLYTELRKDYDKLFEENRKLKVKHYKEQSDKILKSTLNSIYVRNGLREIGYEQGQTDLWDKLQNMRDVTPEEFDPECETLSDIIDMDLEDFLDS